LDQELNNIFKRLQKSHEILIQLRNHNETKNATIRPLFESFALCSGAFYHLFNYQKLIEELKQSQKMIPVHQDSWDIFHKVFTFEEIAKKFENREEIQSELHTMAIADTTIRVYSASALIFNERKKQSKVFEYQELIKKIYWSYPDYFLKNTCDWDRGKIFKEYREHKEQNSPQQIQKGNPNICCLLFLIAFRDEYCHSEYYDNCEGKTGSTDMQEYLKKRHKIVEFPHSQQRLLEANIIFIKIILDNIQQISQFIASSRDIEG